MENLDEIHMRKENRHFIVLSLPKYVGRLLKFMFVNFENDELWTLAFFDMLAPSIVNFTFT